MITLHSQGFHYLSSETAKVDDTKIKRMADFFFFHSYLLSIAVLSRFFSLLHCLEAAFKNCKTVKVHMGDLAPIIDTVFMKSVIYITSQKPILYEKKHMMV